MKIKCEHCNSLIDIENQNKCYNCGAPYTNNKEYKKYLERKELLEKKSYETKLNVEKMANSIISTTFKTFTIAKIISFIIIIIVLISFVFILYNGLTINNSSNNIINTNINDNQDNEKIMSTLIFNSNLELFKGAQNGFLIKQLIDNVINKNAKYENHIITIIYKEKIYTFNDDLLQLKKKFNDNKDYNVLFEYDNDGYINKIYIGNN